MNEVQEDRFIHREPQTVIKPPMGILGMKSNSDIEREKADRAAEMAVAKTTAEADVVVYCQKLFDEAQNARDNSGVTEKLRDALRRRKGIYSEVQLAQIKQQKLSEIYIGVSEIQCNAGEAWLHDIDLSVGNKVWQVKPSPDPELGAKVEMEVAEKVVAVFEKTGPMPEDEAIELEERLREEVESRIKKEAADRCKRLKTRIEDILANVHFDEVKDQFRSNVITFGTGILKGPVVWRQKERKWSTVGPIAGDTLVYGAIAVNPLDFFPCAKAETTEDGDMFEWVHMDRADLSDMLSFDSKYIKHDNIRAILKENEEGIRDELLRDTERDKLENKSGLDTEKSGQFDVREMWGSIPGSVLLASGVDGIEDGKDYSFMVQWLNGRAIKIMPNPDPMGRNPYHEAVFKRVSGSFWGKGSPELMNYAQDMANSSARSICNNMGIASGPIVDVDINQVPPEHLKAAGSIWPWQVRFTESKPGITRAPVNYWQADLHVNELLAVLDRAITLAEDATGIPKYAYGNSEVKGAAATARGLDMLLNAAARGIKKSISNMDRAISRLIDGYVTWIMLYDEDTSIKGDVQIITEGTINVLLTELRMARMGEFMDRFNNPALLEAAGPEVLLELTREYGELLKIDVENILPTKDEVTKRLDSVKQAQQEAAASDQALNLRKIEGPLEIKREELALKREELAVKQAELEIDRERAVMERARGIQEIESKIIAGNSVEKFAKDQTGVVVG